MRNLLTLILLAIFTLQATVVVVEEHVATKDRVGFVVPMADDLAPLQDQTDTADDDARLSWDAIEELSDFMPIEAPVPVGGLRPSLTSPPGTVFLSTDLQGLKPPPRA